MSKKQDSAILRYNYYLKLKSLGYDDLIINILLGHCWNMNCYNNTYKQYIIEKGYKEMKFDYLFNFIDEGYIKGHLGTDMAHLVSHKVSADMSYSPEEYNHYNNGLPLCKVCHDWYDNWNGGAGKNVKRARTNKEYVEGQTICKNIITQKKNSIIYFENYNGNQC